MARSLLLSFIAVLVLVATAVAGERTLGFTVDDLPRRFNASADRIGIDLYASEMKISQGKEYDLFSIPLLAPGLTLEGGFDRVSREVVTVIARYNAGEAVGDTKRFALCSLALVDVCSPEVTKNQRADALKDAGLTDPANITYPKTGNPYGDSVVGGVHYHYALTDFGAIFGAKPL